MSLLKALQNLIYLGLIHILQGKSWVWFLIMRNLAYWLSSTLVWGLISLFLSVCFILFYLLYKYTVQWYLKKKRTQLLFLLKKSIIAHTSSSTRSSHFAVSFSFFFICFFVLIFAVSVLSSSSVSLFSTFCLLIFGVCLLFGLCLTYVSFHLLFAFCLLFGLCVTYVSFHLLFAFGLCVTFTNTFTWIIFFFFF